MQLSFESGERVAIVRGLHAPTPELQLALAARVRVTLVIHLKHERTCPFACRDDDTSALWWSIFKSRDDTSLAFQQIRLP
jgi:hypothetical protein